MIRNFFNSKISVIALFALFLGWLLLWFDCDPSILRRYGDFGDEGYWFQNAANKLNHGRFLTDDQGQAFFGAPLYNWLLTVFIRLGDSRIFLAKLLSVLCTFGSGILLFRILNSFVQNRAQVLLFVVLFFSLAEVKYYSAWISPVSMEMLGLMGYLAFVLKNDLSRTKNAMIAGFLVLLCLGIKLTSITLIPVLALHIVYDLLKNNIVTVGNYRRGLLRLLAGIGIPVFGYIFINLLLKQQYPAEFKQFGQVVAWNLNLKVGLNSIINESLNIAFYLKGFTGILKYPTSSLLIAISFFMFLKFFGMLNFGKWRAAVLADRNGSFIFILLGISFLYLSITGTMGFDRRLIVYLPIFVLLGALLWQGYSETVSLNKINRILNFGLVILILGVQFWALRETGLLNIAKVRNLLAILAFLSIVIVAVYRQFAPLFLILSNVVLVLFFPPKGTQLAEARNKVKEITAKHNAVYISGQEAHLLAMDSKVIPIWYLKNMFTWNHKLNLFQSNRPVALVECVNHPNPGYLNRLDLPKDTKLIDSAVFSGFRYAGRQGFTRNKYKVLIVAPARN